VLVDVAALDDVDVDAEAEERLAAGSTAWLFVGRVAPNKAHQDLVKAFAAYRRAYQPDAVLRIVGPPSSEAYSKALHAFVGALGLADAVDFTGPVSETALAAHYRAADVFVCVSDHEGFCVPLLEAMHHRLPVVAYASSAVPETLGRAGLVLESKAPTTVAAAVHRVVTDEGLRSGLVAAGTRRLADFDLAVTSGRMADALGGLVAGNRPS
jgi:glycosyltransferase involved in cell wall biosynthesis